MTTTHEWFELFLNKKCEPIWTKNNRVITYFMFLTKPKQRNSNTKYLHTAQSMYIVHANIEICVSVVVLVLYIDAKLPPISGGPHYPPIYPHSMKAPKTPQFTPHKRSFTPQGFFVWNIPLFICIFHQNLPQNQQFFQKIRLRLNFILIYRFIIVLSYIIVL